MQTYDNTQFMSTVHTERHFREHVILLLLSVAVMFGAMVLRPGAGGGLELPIPAIDVNAPLPPVCWAQRVTGLPCPGCGLTRSFTAMAHARVWEAFGYNAVGPFLFVVVLFQIPYRIVEISGIGAESSVWIRLRSISEYPFWAVIWALVIVWPVKLLWELGLIS